MAAPQVDAARSSRLDRGQRRDPARFVSGWRSRGWVWDVARVDQLAAEKLKAGCEAIAAEGRKRIEVAPDFTCGRAFGPAPAQLVPSALEKL